MSIRRFDPADADDVIALWERCGLIRPWNDPRKDIARKLLVQPELFIVDDDDGDESGIAATVMAGYDGHRGWLYYVAVRPELQRTGIARRIVSYAEQRLLDLGCPKVNIQIRSGNEAVAQVWAALGYTADSATGLGKRLIPDV